MRVRRVPRRTGTGRLRPPWWRRGGSPARGEGPGGSATGPETVSPARRARFAGGPPGKNKTCVGRASGGPVRTHPPPAPGGREGRGGPEAGGWGAPGGGVPLGGGLQAKGAGWSWGGGPWLPGNQRPGGGDVVETRGGGGLGPPPAATATTSRKARP